jgi:hypothetical protein
MTETDSYLRQVVTLGSASEAQLERKKIVADERS